jgi:protein SCO1/2
MKPMSLRWAAMRRPPHLALLGLATALVLALVVAVILRDSAGHRGPSTSEAASPSSQGSGFDGAALPGTATAPDFSLSDQLGRSVSLADYRGRVTVVSFLYSSCGATCVLIAQQIRGALDELARPVPVLIISADPAGDSPRRVGRFLAQASLSGRVEYLTGSPARLRPVWRAFHIAPAADGRAAFERTASVLLLDGRGRERVVYGLEQLTPESLAHDIRRLQAG